MRSSSSFSSGRRRGRPGLGWGPSCLLLLLLLLLANACGAAANARTRAVRTFVFCQPAVGGRSRPLRSGVTGPKVLVGVRSGPRRRWEWDAPLTAASTPEEGAPSSSFSSAPAVPDKPALRPGRSVMMGVPRFVVSLVLGLLGAGAMAKFLVPRGTAAAPLAATLLPLILCLTGGLPLASIGSWRSPAAVLHRISGVGCLVAPLFLVVREAITAQHAPAPLYYLTVAAIAANLVFGVALIPSRFPAYDVPAARGLAVGSLYGLAFLGWSLTFRVGACPWYAPLGKLFALVALYGWLFACSDAVQNCWCWVRGKYKTELGRKWDLPFEPSSYRQVFFENMFRQPTPRALRASLMTAWHGALPTVFVALLGSVSLLQLAYLRWGPASIAHLTALHPHFARWASYQSLLAVAANQFAVFLVTLVIHDAMSLGVVAFFNAMVPLVPLLNIVAFCLRYMGSSFPGMVRAILESPSGAASAVAAKAVGQAALQAVATVP